MSKLGKYQAQWESNATSDPLWAILTDSQKSGRKWDEHEFFESGEVEVARVFELLEGHAPLRSREFFLDFGCGVGRATRALGERFHAGVGIDISERMVELARHYQGQRASSVTFAVNQNADLTDFATGSIDLVYSHMVLQHMPAEHQRGYIREFFRILRPGGLAVFQSPSGCLDMRSRIRNLVPAPARRIARRLLRGNSVLMEMHVLKSSSVLEIASSSRCQLERMVFSNSTDTDHKGRLVFGDRSAALERIRTKQTTSPYLSSFYVFRKCGLPGARLQQAG